MTILDNVRRRPTPSGPELLNEHILPERPVIFTDLFAGDPIADIIDAAAARSALGRLRLKTRLNYVSGLMDGEGPADETADTWEQSLSEYLDYGTAHPDTRRCCVEFTTPPELRGLFSVPAMVRDLEVLPEDLLSLLFVANRGNSAHMHFDCDHRQVLLHQVMGTKRVMVVSARAGRKVLPVGSLSGLMIERRSEDEKARFVAGLGAYDTLLRPGETLFIPALAWHYVEYVEAGMSFSLRFGRRELDRLIADEVFHDMYVQNVGAALIRNQVNGHVEGRIREAVATQHPSPAARYHSLRDLFEELFHELCPDAFPRQRSGRADRIEARLGTDFYGSSAYRNFGADDAWRR
jgi:Cupin-like domain